MLPKLHGLYTKLVGILCNIGMLMSLTAPVVMAALVKRIVFLSCPSILKMIHWMVSRNLIQMILFVGFRGLSCLHNRYGACEAVADSGQPPMNDAHDIPQGPSKDRASFSKGTGFLSTDGDSGYESPRKKRRSQRLYSGYRRSLDDDDRLNGAGVRLPREESDSQEGGGPPPPAEGGGRKHSE